MPKTIYTNNNDLIRDKRFTYLTDDVVNTGTTIRVQSLIGFENPNTSSGQVILIGEIGNERSELVISSNSVYPSNSYKDVTVGAMIFDHPQDTKVYILDWNRVDIRWASTVTGTKSTIRAYPLPIQADLDETQIRDTTQTSGYYFTRFNETIGDTNSDFSDAIPYGGYDDNTVFMIKKRALDSINEQIDDKLITHEFLNETLWQCRREYHQSPGKRPFRRKFNTDIGNVLTGSFRIELPIDVEKPFTAENIYGVRIGAQQNMSYYDKKEFDSDYVDKPHTILAHAYTAGTSTSIWLANGRDFPGSATINVEGEEIGITRVEGHTGDAYLSSFRIYSHPTGAWNASIGSDVWQNTTLGLPDKFTVFADPGGSAYIYFNRPFSTVYISQNIYADYYRTLLGYDSDADVLDEPVYDLFVPYLAYRIKKRKNKGLSELTDSDYQEYTFKKGTALSAEYIGTEIRISPNIDDLPVS